MTADPDQPVAAALRAVLDHSGLPPERRADILRGLAVECDGAAPSPDLLFDVAGCLFDPARRVLTGPDGALIPASIAELTVLTALARAWPEPVSRDALSRAALHRPWAYGARAIDQVLFKLRGRLPVDAQGLPGIVGFYGLGYALRGPVKRLSRDGVP